MTGKMKNRLLRLFIGYILPVFLAIAGIACVSMCYFLFKGKGLYYIYHFYFNFLLSISLLSIYFLSIPSLIYSCLMEFLINPKIMSQRLVVIISVILGGGFTAVGIWLYALSGDSSPIIYYITDLFIGCLVGFFSGMWLHFTYVKHCNKEYLPRWCIVINTLIAVYFACVMVFGVWVFIDMINSLSYS